MHINVNIIIAFCLVIWLRMCACVRVCVCACTYRLAAQECELFSRYFRGKTDNLLSGLQYFNDVDMPSDEIRCFTDCIDVFDQTTNT